MTDRKQQPALQKVPDRTVVLSFDDGCKSDLTVVGPMLKEMGFGATFYTCDAFARNTKNPENYVTWAQARQIEQMGFEIGNHTRNHPDCRSKSVPELTEELAYVEEKCLEHGIAKPTTFCYPGYTYGPEILQVLKERGYLFARRGAFPETPYDNDGQRGPFYDPKADHPLLVPTTGAAGPHWGMKDLVWCVEEARDGKIAVLNFHGVPDVEHPWVHTDVAVFRQYMDYLRQAGCTVIAMRDLSRYVDPTTCTQEPLAMLERKLK